MKFTFGITTTKEIQRSDGSNIKVDNHVRAIINSIRKNNIPKDNYEIIVIGGENDYVEDDDVKFIEFDDVAVPGWFTRKKNLITKNAKFENIVFSHDYLIYDENWYKGFLKFGNDWDICMCIIKAKEEHRYRDWFAWDDPELCIFGPNIKLKDGKIWDGSDHKIALVPYDYTKTQYMSISGFWWIAKKHVMEQDPLDENIKQGGAEDVAWSFQVRDKYKYVMNTNSIIQEIRGNKRLSAYYVGGYDKWTSDNWIDRYK